MFTKKLTIGTTEDCEYIGITGGIGKKSTGLKPKQRQRQFKQLLTRRRRDAEDGGDGWVLFSAFFATQC